MADARPWASGASEQLPQPGDNLTGNVNRHEMAARHKMGLAFGRLLTIVQAIVAGTILSASPCQSVIRFSAGRSLTENP